MLKVRSVRKKLQRKLLGDQGRIEEQAIGARLARNSPPKCLYSVVETQPIEVEVLFSQAGIATAILVTLGDIYILVDAGDGVLRDLLGKGVHPQRLGAVLLTHGHSDHIAGLYALLGYLRGEAFRGVFNLVYPAGCCEVEAMLEAFFKCYAGTISFAINRFPMRDKSTLQLGPIHVQAWQMLHWHSVAGNPISPAPALGFRLSYQGQTVALTGDTAFFPELTDFVKDVDIAVIEATLNEPVPGTSTYVHLTMKQAQRLAGLAKRGMFIHRKSQTCQKES